MEEKYCCLFDKECPHKDIDNCLECPEYKEIAAELNQEED